MGGCGAPRRLREDAGVWKEGVLQQEDAGALGGGVSAGGKGKSLTKDNKRLTGERYLDTDVRIPGG